MSGLAKLKAFIEKGARHSANDQKMLQTMHDHSVSMGPSCGSMAESAFSRNDELSILSSELREDIDQNAYILDVFDTNLVYSVGYSWSSGGSSSFQIDYTVLDNGDVTWGTPVEVVRKVTYVPTVEEVTTGESAEIDINSDSISLVERAVSNDGTVMLKLISEGVGSSGYYPKEVLQRDGPKVFKKGLFNLIDHPTAQEEKARPEGSVLNVGSTLKEDAKWYDSWKDKNGVDQGAGLYAPAVVKPTFREDLAVIANDIGMSIRAKGKARKGMIDGVEMPIIESIDTALSVDYVTMAGRGGKVIDMMESARTSTLVTKETQAMAVSEEEFTKLQENNRKLADQVARLTEGAARATALQNVDQVLKSYPTLPRSAKERVRRSFETCDLTFTESGLLDTSKLVESVKNAVAEETAYLTQLGVGSVKGLGSNHTPLQESDPDKMYAEFVESLKDL